VWGARHYWRIVTPGPKLNADDLHALGLYPAKPFDCRDHATGRLLGDGQHVARHVAVFRPQMQQGLAASPRTSQESGEMAVMRLPFSRISMATRQGIPAGCP
jgi:hypothetical protein